MKKLSDVSIFNSRQVRFEEIKSEEKKAEYETIVNVENDELQGGDGWLFGESLSSMNNYIEEYE